MHYARRTTTAGFAYAVFTVCALFLFVSSPLSAGGTEEIPAGTSEAPNWSITVPSSVKQGECLIVAFTPEDGMNGAAVSIKNENDKAIASGTAFPTGRGELVALIGIGPDAAAGTRTVEASAIFHGVPVFSTTPLTVDPGEFVAESIALDDGNTAIKTDLGPKRMEEIRALNAILFAQNNDAPRFTGPFAAPVTSTRRTAQYGDRRTYVYANGKQELSLHYGIDYGVPTGTPVYTSGGGLVVMARKRISTGWTLVVEHLPGVYSLYYHCSKLLVAEGDVVPTGKEIALSGATGLATGPHLHHEYRVRGIAVSPDWFSGRTLY